MANGRNITDNKYYDPRGAHIRLYCEIVDSNAWRCLLATDQIAYIALHRSLRSTNNGDLSLPLSVARRHGIKSSATLVKNLRALVAVGLLAVTRKGGCMPGGQRLPNLYRFTDHPAYENQMKNIEASKATNEWKSIKTLGQGRQAMRQAEVDAAKTHLQKLAHTASKIELVGRKASSKTEVWPPFPTSKSEIGKKPETAYKAKARAGFEKMTTPGDSGNHPSNIEVLSTVAIPMVETRPFESATNYRRLTAKPVGFFTNLIK